MSALEGAVVAVTGASRGIGAAVARAVAGRGARVGLIARTSGDLDAVLDGLGTEGVVAAADVADRTATIEALAGSSVTSVRSTCWSPTPASARTDRSSTCRTRSSSGSSR